MTWPLAIATQSDCAAVVSGALLCGGVRWMGLRTSESGHVARLVSNAASRRPVTHASTSSWLPVMIYAVRRHCLEAIALQRDTVPCVFDLFDVK